MKYYLVEPTYKKSVIEFTVFRRVDEDGNASFLRREIGWRWGSFIFEVPETDEEIKEFVEGQGYESVEEWVDDHSFDEEDLTLNELIVRRCLPDENEEFVDVTEDYPNAELLESWDGCWTYWSLYSSDRDIDLEEEEVVGEEAQEAYFEEGDEGVEDLGWEFIDTYFEIQDNPKITPCDENGNLLEESDGEEE